MGSGKGEAVVLVFRGTHEVLAAEKILKGGALPVRLIPAPRRLAADCGLAVSLPAADLAGAVALLAGGGIRPASAHRVLSPGNYEAVPL